MQGKLLRQTLDKFLKAPAAQEARVQVVLPNESSITFKVYNF